MPALYNGWTLGFVCCALCPWLWQWVDLCVNQSSGAAYYQPKFVIHMGALLLMYVKNRAHKGWMEWLQDSSWTWNTATILNISECWDPVVILGVCWYTFIQILAIPKYYVFLCLVIGFLLENLVILISYQYQYTELDVHAASFIC